MSFRYNTRILYQQNELKHLTNFYCSDFHIPSCLILFPRSPQRSVLPNEVSLSAFLVRPGEAQGPLKGYWTRSHSKVA